MNYCIIPLTSVTAAKRLEKEAMSNGILCRVVATPKGLSNRGCSHSVRLREQDVSGIVTLGRNLNLSMGGVYLEVKYGQNINYVRQEQYNDIF